MTYNEDPNINRRDRIVEGQRNSTGMWIAGAVAVCLVIGLVAFARTRGTDDTAMTEKPASGT